MIKKNKEKEKKNKENYLIIFGDTTIDKFLITENIIINEHEIKDSLKKNLKKKRLYYKDEEFLAFPLGAKLLIKEDYQEIGGGASNLSFVLKKLNNNYSKKLLITSMGKDYEAKKINSFYKKNKIKTLFIKKKKSNFSIILESLKDRLILTRKYDDDIINKKEIINNLKKIIISKKEYNFNLYLSSVSIKEFLLFHEIINLFKKSKINFNLIINPSIYFLKLIFSNDLRKKIFLKLIKDTKLIILNKEEYEFLLKKISKKKYLEKNKKLIITKGADGIKYIDYEKRLIITIKRKKSIKVIDSTGAGDVFNATFLSLINEDIIIKLIGAMINAEYVITQKGAKNSLSLRTIKKRIKESLNKEDYKIIIRNNNQ